MLTFSTADTKLDADREPERNNQTTFSFPTFTFADTVQDVPFEVFSRELPCRPPFAPNSE